jgi:hypothetical protein
LPYRQPLRVIVFAATLSKRNLARVFYNAVTLRYQ